MVSIRQARPDEYSALGQMTVDVYEQLPGMPDREEQPDYYAMLFDVKKRALTPTTEIWVAKSADHQLLGGVTFIGDVKYYGAGGSISTNTGCSGIRLLAVDPRARRLGVGSALTIACIDRAEQIGSEQVLLHTTKAMAAAWVMYEKMGFKRSEDLDFKQGQLAVYGFRLKLDAGSGIKK